MALNNKEVNLLGTYDNNICNIHISLSHIKICKYIKETLTELKQEIYSNIIIIEYFNIPLSVKNNGIKQIFFLFFISEYYGVKNV